MTRVTLGHTGQALTADTGIVAIYLLLILSVMARILAGLIPEFASILYVVSGPDWIGAFGGFSVNYGYDLLRAGPES